jgi:LuxR family maltose regulon positive regulatory protein
MGTSNSAARLRDLELSNLLIVPLDYCGDWYRYHHLIEQWLRTELLTNDPDLVTELHRRAARWFVEAGDPESAFDHAIAATDAAMATDVAERYWHTLLATGRHVTLQTWLERLAGNVEDSARLSLARAQLARNTGESVDVAKRWLRRAGELADPADDEVMVSLHTNLMVHERMVGDLGAAEAHGRLALAASDDTTAPEVRALLGATLGQLGAFDESIDHLTQSLATVDSESDPLTEIFALSHLSLPLYESGQRRRAGEVARSALDRAAGTNFERSPILASARVVLGMLCLDDLDHDGAKGHLDWALTAARSVGSDTAQLHALLAAARHAGMNKHSMEARRLVGDARALTERMPDPGRLASLVDVAEQHSLGGSTSPIRSVNPALVEDLTDRELSVLRMFASQLSLRDVGTELSMSYNTAKGHTKVIYRKLGVHSRRDAVEVATKLGLL